MKYLMALNAAQLACLVALLVMVGGMTNPGPVSAGDTNRVFAEMPWTDSATDGNQLAVRDPSSGTLSEAELRRIIREELDAHGVATAKHDDADRESSGTRQRNQAEDKYRTVFVEQQIEYYRSVGEITPLQMQDLQMEIAKLDHAGRKQALSNLMRAMNAGEIRGQL